jgi:hypothetical protein
MQKAYLIPMDFNGRKISEQEQNIEFDFDQA